MATKIDDSQLITAALRAKFLAQATKSSVKKLVRHHAFAAVRKAKQQMPRKTGQAMGRFGTPEAAGGFWTETTTPNTFTVERGADLEPYEYIIKLNQGSSKQAPAGFLDVIQLQAEDDLYADIDADIAAELQKKV